jgi:DNA-directed RNA polymerase specialized sigma24 family protein
MSSGKKEWEVTQESFERMLSWLDPDREQAGEKYEVIRRQLIKIFVCRGSAVPEELADTTINRVISKAPVIADSYVGNPALYFYGVAKLVHLEYLRKKPEPMHLPPPDTSEQESDRAHECLDHCMDGLPPRNRELILEYYSEEKQAKIDSRKSQAEKLGIEPKVLRLRATRIRASLQECLSHCLDGQL